MKKRSGFIFTNKKQSQKAVMSIILGVICLVALIAAVYLSYLNDGGSVGSFGMTGILIIVFSLTGLVLGVITVMEKECYKLFPILGIVFNLLSLGGISLVLYAGAYL